MTPVPTSPSHLADISEIVAQVRPVWSVMVPTYRPDRHLKEALLAALRALEVCGATWELEVVDDASPGLDVDVLISSWGITEVKVFRRSENGGLAGCWNTCVERARGELIHILHQDDLIKPDFYQRMSHAAVRFPQAVMIFCRTEFLETTGSRLDELEQANEGLIDDWLVRISAGQRLQCASVVMRHETYEHVGYYAPDLRYIIDWEMWVRIAAFGAVAYVPEALAVYRIHDGAETKRIKAAAGITKDMVRGLTRIKRTLREANRSDCLPIVTAYAVRASGYAAYDAEQARDPDTAAKEIWTSMWFLGMRMGTRQFLGRVRWYVRIRLGELLS